MFEDDKERHLVVLSIEDLNKKDVAYNFTVADFHTYYVTEHNVLVHNCDKKRFNRKPAKTESAAKKIALSLGYKSVGKGKFKTTVYYNKKAPLNRKFIILDAKKHSGGSFKGGPTFSSVDSKKTRGGTFDENLEYIGE